MKLSFSRSPHWLLLSLFAFALFSPSPSHGEGMIQYFNTSWKELAEKIPELAEAGYESIWVPPTDEREAAASRSVTTLWDRFDLGGKGPTWFCQDSIRDPRGTC